ncbi:MAG: DHH family phosphoesterase [Nanoarchaeota archaeon]|nr:DHH family phosphoesterase [Nanoarchaeota archaeon]
MESFFPPELFNRISKFIEEAGSILLLSHLDADGLSSAGLISSLLLRKNKNFTVRILKQLEDSKEFETSNDLIIITDMGSGQLNLVREHVNNKRFIIIDHHQDQNYFEHENLIHFNPCLNDDSYSASSLSYLIASSLEPSLEELIHLGLIGAVGDMQYKKGFKGLNLEILEKAEEKKVLSILKGLDIFGRVSKPVHEALAYSFEILIPGVSGNESSAIELLSELNIDLKNSEGKWKTLATLEENEMKKLVTNIIMRRLANKLDSNVLSDIIVLNNKQGVLSDLKEWSVLLNACGRQGAYSLGVLLCMGFEDYSLPLIEKVIKDYKRLIVEAMNLVQSDSSVLNQEGSVLIINGRDKIKDTIIGTIGGMLLKNNGSKAETFIGFAERDSDNLKVSCRTLKDYNIGEVLKTVCEELECLGGGHKFAGGALIPKNKQEDFLKLFKNELEKHL